MCFYSTHYTNSISDIYTYANGNVRLYVIGDIGTTSYGAIVRNGFFNTSGVYQNSTASGTFVSQTHYSGAFRANTASANTVTLASTASSSNTAYVGQEFWIVNGTQASVLSIPIGQKASVSSYNGVTKVATLNKNVIANVGETYSIGALTTNEVGSVSGVFNCPGGYFRVGERTFRLDNRIISEGATDFFYNKGTETTSAEATFFAQGLSTTSQKINYSASVSGQANTITTIKTVNDFVTNTQRTGGGGGCCVISTAMSDMGIWSTDQKFDLVEWCEKYLHNKTIGECFRRGYQVIGVDSIYVNPPDVSNNRIWVNGIFKFNPGDQIYIIDDFRGGTFSSIGTNDNPREYRINKIEEDEQNSRTGLFLNFNLSKLDPQIDYNVGFQDWNGIETNLRVVSHFDESNWKSGYWTNGYFENGFFESGVWYNGVFEGTWGN